DSSSLSSVSPEVDNFLSSNSSSVSTAIVENLRSLIRQREGQLQSATNSINRLKEQLETAEQQLIQYNNNKLTSQSSDIISARYEAALLLIGEKEEELLELREEMEYVKNMFRM